MTPEHDILQVTPRVEALAQIRCAADRRDAECGRVPEIGDGAAHAGKQ